MGYKNGAEILPSHLLEEVQKYVEGGLIYIPKTGNKAGWGYLSGTRNVLDKRNKKILTLYKQGYSVELLSQKFYLSEESIKKIIYKSQK